MRKKYCITYVMYSFTTTATTFLFSSQRIFLTTFLKQKKFFVNNKYVQHVPHSSTTYLSFVRNLKGNQNMSKLLKSPLLYESSTSGTCTRDTNQHQTKNTHTHMLYKLLPYVFISVPL